MTTQQDAPRLSRRHPLHRRSFPPGTASNRCATAQHVKRAAGMKVASQAEVGPACLQTVKLDGDRTDEVVAIHAEPLVDAALALNHPGGDAVRVVAKLAGDRQRRR